VSGILSVAVGHRQGAFALSARFETPGGVTALFGRSGSGKTTLVNAIGGLLRPDRGRVALGDTVLLDTERGLFVPRHRRRIGIVFQEGRLFPHLSVRQNLLFGRWFAPRDEEGVDVGTVVDLLGIGPLLGRRPAGLSGGEKQRVAIGRALLSKPRLLLMDEPLAALDHQRKAEILPYIERLRDEAGVPIVYVSHSVAEVARLADTLVVLEEGRVTAAGPAADMLARLNVAPLAEARDAGAVLDARVAAQDEHFGLTTLTTAAGPAADMLARLNVAPLAEARDAGAVLDARVAAQDEHFGLTTLTTAAGTLRVPRIALPVGAVLRVQVPARDVMLSLGAPSRSSALNVLPAVVVEILPAGDAAGPAASLRLHCNGVALLARVTRLSVVEMGLAPGVPVFAAIKSVALDTSPGADGRLARYDGTI